MKGIRATKKGRNRVGAGVYCALDASPCCRRIVRRGRMINVTPKKEVRGKVGGQPQWWRRTKPPSTWDYLRFIQRQKTTATYFLSKHTRTHTRTHTQMPTFSSLPAQTFTHSGISDIPGDMCIPAGIPRYTPACSRTSGMLCTMFWCFQLNCIWTQDCTVFTCLLK